MNREGDDLRISLIDNPTSSDTNASPSPSLFARLGKFIEPLVVLFLAIVGVPLLCFLFPLITIAIVSISLFVNTLIHIWESVNGDVGCHGKVKIPISDVAAATILLLTTIILSISMGILQALDGLDHILLGLAIRQWFLIFIVVFGYYSIWTGSLALFTPWYHSQPSLRLKGLVEAVHCILLLPTLILMMKIVPSWRDHAILGLPTWKWIRAILLITLVQDAISLVMQWTTASVLITSLWCRRPEKCKGHQCVVYYVRGLRTRIAFIIVAVVHLLAWQLYFRHHFVDSPMATEVLSFGTRTFVSELICGGLLCLKNFMLLRWQAHTVYHQCKDKEIMRKLAYWYCLYSLLRPLVLEESPPEPAKSHEEEHDPTWKLDMATFSSVICKFLREKILQRKITEQTKEKTGEWQEANKTLVEVVSREEEYASERDSRIPDQVQGEGARDPTISIHEKEMISRAVLLDDRSLPVNQNINMFLGLWVTNLESPYGIDGGEISREMFQQSLIPVQNITGDPNLLGRIVFKQVKDINKNQNEVINCQDFEAWMGIAQQICSELQFFMEGAQDVVKFLNRLMNVFVIALVVIIWLRLTQILVTTKAIVAMTSTILGTTFIFGETVKTLFQGIVFVCINCPFTVGDLCVIDKTLMEVKEIGIWRTTFSKIGNEEEVILYPNSVLASKGISNYEGKIRRDSVSIELSLERGKREHTIKSLKSKLKKCKNIRQRCNREATQAASSTGRVGNPEMALSGSGPTEIEEVVEDSHPSSDDQTAEVVQKNDSDDDYDFEVERVQVGKIKMTVPFEHDKSILYMTNTQAVDAIIKRRYHILERVAEFISEILQETSIYNA